MHIGEPQRIVIVEPVEDPVPRQKPVPERPVVKPSPAPNEREPVPSR
jgi:hypothetical protein